MELPEDVLGLIRDYSRPRFTHFRIYNQAVKVLEKDMVSLHVLKEKLQSDSAEKIIPVLTAYMEALVRRKIQEQTLNLYTFSHKHKRILTEPETREGIRLMDLLIESRRKEMGIYFELIGYMYNIQYNR